MDIFQGITNIDWGFNAADIFSNGMFLVGSVAAFVLLGLAIAYVPKLIGIIRTAVASRSK
ncbi:hypothetical protein [Paenibacillus lactis]|uniref:PTS ascorbate transporter subunit IIC n=1 Tax=Paenibacillus lactis TaxID=228574 RepID=A0ABS4FLD7_9BACL|nr:hypothetical protein [Paenibacillus lactis]MBP1897069.1 hypothetical protein [Paenibacillus lactis]HAS7789732.1 hypothetical protein [Vibrio cholerae]